jgi:hypothetical protein
MNYHEAVRLQLFMTAIVKVTAYWDMAPCSLVEVDRRFRGVYCLHYQGHFPEAIRHIPEGCHFLKMKLFILHYWN